MEKYKIQPFPVSKQKNQDNLLRNRDVLMGVSERTYGSKLRRIDDWGNKVRGGDC
jgi:hypothetical protein